MISGGKGFRRANEKEMKKMSKLRKVILIIVIMAAAYFVVTFVASLVQYSSNLAKSVG